MIYQINYKYFNYGIFLEDFIKIKEDKQSKIFLTQHKIRKIRKIRKIKKIPVQKILNILILIL